MISQDYEKELKQYATKFDKISFDFSESLDDLKHRMRVEGKVYENAVECCIEELSDLEKVDLIDYQKFFDC